MQRNDLIGLLAQYDNDNVTMKINGMTIDVAAVTMEQGNLVISPHPADGTDSEAALEGKLEVD